jgi:hypothetical protein
MKDSTKTLKEILGDAVYWPHPIYWEDFRSYAHTLKAQGVTSILVPLWLKEYYDGELQDTEEWNLLSVFQFLDKQRITWLSLVD